MIQKTIAFMLAALLLLPVFSSQTARAAGIIASVVVTGIEAPIGGATPDYDAVLTAEGCSMETGSGPIWNNGISWRDMTSERPLLKSDTFVAGHVYRVYVMLDSDAGFTFYSAGDTVATSATLNSKDAVVESISPERVWLYRDFTCRLPVIEATDVDAPEAGKTPDYSVVVSFDLMAAAHADRDLYDGSGWQNGVRWIDAQTDAVLDPSDTFAKGHTYTVQVRLKPATSSDIIYDGESMPPYGAKVNGQDAKWVKLSGDLAAISYTFAMIPEDKPVGTAAITGVVAPMIGMTPNYDLTLEADGCVFGDYNDSGWVKGIGWAEKGESVLMKPDDVFEVGHTYQVVVALALKSGYYFFDDAHALAAEVTINGFAPTDRIDYDWDYVAFVYEFPKLLFAIPSLNISDIDAPEAGAKPDYEAALSATGCGINTLAGDRNGIAWHDVTAGQAVGPDEAFIAGHAYSVSVTLQALRNFTFRNADGTPATKATIDGAPAADFVAMDEDKAVVSFVFPAVPRTAGPVAITELDAPAAGKTPDYDVTVTGEGAAANSFNEPGGVKNGVLWVDEGAGMYMSPDAVFEAGRIYTVRVFVNPTEGYTFFEGEEFATAATINGETAEAHRYETPTGAYFSYTFPTLPAAEEPAIKLIDKVDIAIKAPEVGQNPSYVATLSGTDCHPEPVETEFWHGGVRWDIVEIGMPMAADGVFAAGDYQVVISLIADEGRTFFGEDGKAQTAFTVNGKSVETMSDRDSAAPGRIYLQFRFTVVEAAPDEPTHLFPVDFTGFMEYNGGLFFVSGGDVVTEANGLVEDPNAIGTWYFCANGQAQLQHTGLALYDGQWFYVVNGVLDTTRAGLVDYDGQSFIIAAGRILIEVSGLIQDPVSGVFYYVAEGRVVREYTGLALYDGHWFYVVNGELATGYTGEVEYDGATFSVAAGQVVA